MKAQKENKVYTIIESEASSFINEGYDVYNDDGTIYAYGKGKTVSYAAYMKAKEEIQALQDHVDALESEIKALKKKSTKKEGK